MSCTWIYGWTSQHGKIIREQLRYPIAVQDRCNLAYAAVAAKAAWLVAFSEESGTEPRRLSRSKPSGNDLGSSSNESICVSVMRRLTMSSMSSQTCIDVYDSPRSIALDNSSMRLMTELWMSAKMRSLYVVRVPAPG